MYAAEFKNGSWWVGFKYSNGEFDPITNYGQEEGLARNAAKRMNRRN